MNDILKCTRIFRCNTTNSIELTGGMVWFTGTNDHGNLEYYVRNYQSNYDETGTALSRSSRIDPAINLYIRQVVITKGESMNPLAAGIASPKYGYAKSEKVPCLDPTIYPYEMVSMKFLSYLDIQETSVSTKFQNLELTTGFDHNGIRITPLIPQNYRYLGHKLSNSEVAQYPTTSGWTEGYPLVNMRTQYDWWVTIYLEVGSGKPSSLIADENDLGKVIP